MLEAYELFLDVYRQKNLEIVKNTVCGVHTGKKSVCFDKWCDKPSKVSNFEQMHEVILQEELNDLMIESCNPFFTGWHTSWWVLSDIYGKNVFFSLVCRDQPVFSERKLKSPETVTVPLTQSFLLALTWPPHWHLFIHQVKNSCLRPPAVSLIQSKSVTVDPDHMSESDIKMMMLLNHSWPKDLNSRQTIKRTRCQLKLCDPGVKHSITHSGGFYNLVCCIR